MPNRTYVTNPAPAPYRFGLLSALTQMPPTPPHWINGVDFRADGCAAAHAWPDPCGENPPGPEDTKVFADSADYDHGDPFTIYSGLACKIMDLAEANQAIAARFGYGEPRALEHAFWTGDLGNYPALATDPGLVVLSPVVNIEEAVAALEQELGALYGGVGIIHAPRLAMPYAASFHLIEQDGATLTTPLGTLWAFGAGYDPTVAPDGQPDVLAGQTWLYATGAMTARKSEVTILPGDGNDLNRATNETTLLAERTWVLTRDCVTIGILTNLGAVT